MLDHTENYWEIENGWEPSFRVMEWNGKPMRGERWFRDSDDDGEKFVGRNNMPNTNPKNLGRKVDQGRFVGSGIIANYLLLKGSVMKTLMMMRFIPNWSPLTLFTI